MNRPRTAHARTNARVLLATLILAGCTFANERTGPSSEAVPGGPVIILGTCASLDLAASPETITRGTNETIALTLRNCGTTPLPLYPSGRCTRGASLIVEIARGSETYLLHENAPEGVPEDLTGWLASHGPCLAMEPRLLGPGLSETSVLSWNGSVTKLLYLVEQGPAFTGHRAMGRLVWADAGEYTLNAAYSVSAENATQAIERHVRLREPREPDPDRLSGYTLWTPGLPPLNASVPERDPPPEGATPTGEYLPWNIEAAANASHAKWLGAVFTRARLELTSWTYTAECRLSTNVCDRWGWTDYFLLDYELDIPEIDATWTFAQIPIRSDGLVAEDEIWGYPDCDRVPAECEFTINESEAIGIARAAGLNEDAGPIHATFSYSFKNEYPQGVYSGAPRDIYGTFAWFVHNQTGSGEGDAYWIDANDGRVLFKDRILLGTAFDCRIGPC